MNLKELKVRVPKELRKEEVAMALAIELYREGRLTLKQASDLAGFCVEDFMRILSDRGVSVINWDVEELEKEMKNANSF
jgi:predicted HTH domain antitoxin